MAFLLRLVRPVCALAAVTILAQAPTLAREYFVNGGVGTNRAECLSAPAPAAGACRTISYVISGANLSSGGPHTINVAAGEYREQVVFESEDGGSSPSTRVTLKGAGSNQTSILGLDATPLDDSTAVQCTAAVNCAGNGQAYPNTYRFNISGRPEIHGVVETKWTPILVNDSAVTGVMFELTKPIPATVRTSVASVNQLSGSYWVDGNYLYVHTFHDVRPDANVNDVEIIVSDPALQLNTADYVTVEGFRIAYGDYSVVDVDDSKFSVFRDVIVHSGRVVGLWFHLGSTDGTVINADISHVYDRKDFSTATQSGTCYLGTCGWHNKAAGTGLKIDGSTSPANRFLIQHVTAYNAWNVVSVEKLNHCVFEDVFVKNSPNHAIIMVGTNSGSGSDVGNCTGNQFIRTISFNAQDHYYIKGCTNGKIIRSAGRFDFLDKTDSSTGDTQGWTLSGSLSRSVDVQDGSHSGWKANYNWHNPAGEQCRWTGGNDVNCQSVWPSQCNCDSNDNHGLIFLTGLTWPVVDGLATSRLWREDFMPIAGSSTINTGDPDIDADGVLETGPGGDDECTPAHHCIGGRPDIGPFEFAGGSSGGSAPNPPTGVRRTDK